MAEETEGGQTDYSGAFQTKMLRVMFQDSDMCASVAPHLDPVVFDGGARRWLAGTLVSHANRHGLGPSLDAVKIAFRKDTRTGRLTKDNAELAETLVDNLDRVVKDRSFIKEEFYRFIKHQVSRKSIVQAAQLLKLGDFEAVDQEIEKIVSVPTASTGSGGHFYVRDLDKRVQDRKANPMKGIPTGLKLDEYIKCGGLWRKAIGVVVGGYGRGKSSTLVSLARAALLGAGVKILFISLELRESQVADKFDAGFADISLNDLVDDEETVKATVSDLGTKFGDFLVIKEFPSKFLTIPMLKAYIRTLERKGFYFDLIVVDTVEVMKPLASKKNDKAYEEQGGLYVDFRELAGSMDVAGWTGAQLNREGLDKEIATGSKISDSLQKCQIADLIFVINQTPKERKVGIGRLWLDKNRDGPSGFEVPVSLDWSRSLVTDR